MEDPTQLFLYFVGSLPLNQCPEVLDINPTEYRTLEGEQFEGTTVYRYQKNIYQRELTVVVTDNENLRVAQTRGLEDNVKKCITSLDELKRLLSQRENREIDKGKKPTFESVTKNIKEILSGDHMKKIIVYGVDATGDPIKIWYKIDKDKLEFVRNKCLGKIILFTNRYNWSNEKIVSSYRAQFQVEALFKQIKNTKFLSFSPLRHFTDNHIIVHSFYCIMAYTLSCLLQLEMKNIGYDITINNLLSELMEGILVVKINSTDNTKAPQVKMMVTELPDAAKAYVNEYDLKRYIMNH